MAVQEQERFGTSTAVRPAGVGAAASERDLDRPVGPLPAGLRVPASQRDLVRLSLMLHPDADAEAAA